MCATPDFRASRCVLDTQSVLSIKHQTRQKAREAERGPRCAGALSLAQSGIGQPSSPSRIMSAALLKDRDLDDLLSYVNERMLVASTLSRAELEAMNRELHDRLSRIPDRLPDCFVEPRIRQDTGSSSATGRYDHMSYRELQDAVQRIGTAIWATWHELLIQHNRRERERWFGWLRKEQWPLAPASVNSSAAPASARTLVVGSMSAADLRSLTNEQLLQHVNERLRVASTLSSAELAVAEQELSDRLAALPNPDDAYDTRLRQQSGATSTSAASAALSSREHRELLSTYRRRRF